MVVAKLPQSKRVTKAIRLRRGVGKPGYTIGHGHGTGYVSIPGVFLQQREFTYATM